MYKATYYIYVIYVCYIYFIKYEKLHATYKLHICYNIYFSESPNFSLLIDFYLLATRVFGYCNVMRIAKEKCFLISQFLWFLTEKTAQGNNVSTRTILETEC